MNPASTVSRQSLPCPSVRRPAGLPATAAGHAAVWLCVFSGGFVFFEPAPYELLLMPVIGLWLVGGLPIPRAVGPLIVLILAFLAGGLLAMTQSGVLDVEPKYIAVTGFLAVSACFFAAFTADRTPHRLELIANAWIAGACASTLLGLAGYFGLAPEGMFTRYGRAAGGFQDPNVYAPFLVFPLLVLIQRIATRPPLAALLNALPALLIAFGLLLAFSRGAWGMMAVASVLVLLVMFLTAGSAAVRARYLAMAGIGAVVLALLVAAALSVDGISSLFAERARIIQDYDGSQTGRFARHAIGFDLMLRRPLGIGAMEFGIRFNGDEHNIWLKALTSYGWLGFAAFAALTAWTLVAAFPVLFRTSPWQHHAQAAYAVFLGHLVLGMVIDIDHWRHVYLLLGLIWGMIAADRAAAQARMAGRMTVFPPPRSLPRPAFRTAGDPDPKSDIPRPAGHSRSPRARPGAAPREIRFG